MIPSRPAPPSWYPPLLLLGIAAYLFLGWWRSLSRLRYLSDRVATGERLLEAIRAARAASRAASFFHERKDQHMALFSVQRAEEYAAEAQHCDFLLKDNAWPICYRLAWATDDELRRELRRRRRRRRR